MTMDVKRLVCSVNFGANNNATVRKIESIWCWYIYTCLTKCVIFTKIGSIKSIQRGIFFYNYEARNSTKIPYNEATWSILDLLGTRYKTK